MVIRENTLLGSRLPAFFKNIDLFGNIAKSADDFLVPVEECENGIRDPGLSAELQNQVLSATQVMARDAREKMVDGLEL